MRSYNLIVLISTAILIATVVTIIFAIAVYVISRRRRRLIHDENETREGETVVLVDGKQTAQPNTVVNVLVNGKQAVKQNTVVVPKILKLYDPYKKEENRKNGSD
ncbi:MAG: hypothetical protein WCI43_07090 [Candidatus Firestonebacteria bacterium]